MANRNFRKVKSVQSEVILLAGHFAPVSGVLNAVAPMTGSGFLTSSITYLSPGKFRIGLADTYPEFLSWHVGLTNLSCSSVNANYSVQFSSSANFMDKLVASGTFDVCVFSGSTGGVLVDLPADSGNQVSVTIVAKNSTGK